MSETGIEATSGRATWPIWMHVAGIGYAAGIWVFVIAFMFPALGQFAMIGVVAFTVGTFAFVGGWGRYMGTKR